MGFNKLKKLGKTKFHANTLQKHLKSMQERHLIKIKEIKNRKEYDLIDPDFEKLLQFHKADLDKIENDLLTKDILNKEHTLLIGNFIRLSYHKYISLTIAWLYQKYVNDDEPKAKSAEKIRSELLEWTQEKLRRLTEDDQIRVLGMLLSEPPKLLTLKEYRKTHPIK